MSNGPVYRQRVADHQCPRCGIQLTDDDDFTYCRDCRQAYGDYRSSPRGRRAIRRYQSTTKRKEATARRLREMRELKKIAGECRDCPRRALDDSAYCLEHRDLHRASTRDYMRRVAQAKREGLFPLQRRALGPFSEKKRAARTQAMRPPSIDPVHDYRLGDISLGLAAVRYVELHNGVTARDVGDAFGADARERTAIVSALYRARKEGRLRVERDRFAAAFEQIFYPVRRAA